MLLLGGTNAQVQSIDASTETGYVAAVMIHSNAQRAGVLSQMTLDELNSPTDSLMFKIADHETSTKGPTRIVIHKKYHPIIQAYLTEVREKIYTEVPDLENRAFLTWSGKPFSKPGQLMNRVAKRLKCSIPNPTMYRKAMGTRGARLLDDSELRRLNRHMSHDPQTARIYYQFELDDGDSFAAHAQLEELRPAYYDSIDSRSRATH